MTVHKYESIDNCIMIYRPFVQNSIISRETYSFPSFEIRYFELEATIDQAPRKAVIEKWNLFDFFF